VNSEAPIANCIQDVRAIESRRILIISLFSLCGNRLAKAYSKCQFLRLWWLCRKLEGIQPLAVFEARVFVENKYLVQWYLLHPGLKADKIEVPQEGIALKLGV